MEPVRTIEKRFSEVRKAPLLRPQLRGRQPAGHVLTACLCSCCPRIHSMCARTHACACLCVRGARAQFEALRTQLMSDDKHREIVATIAFPPQRWIGKLKQSTVDERIAGLSLCLWLRLWACVSG